MHENRVKQANFSICSICRENTEKYPLSVTYFSVSYPFCVFWQVCPGLHWRIIQFIKEPCGVFLPDHSMNGPWGNYMRCGNTFSGLLFLICMIVCFLITPCFAGQAMSDNGTLPYIGALKPGSISGPGIYYVPVLTKIQGNYSDTLKSHDMS